LPKERRVSIVEPETRGSKKAVHYKQTPRQQFSGIYKNAKRNVDEEGNGKYSTMAGSSPASRQIVNFLQLAVILEEFLSYGLALGGFAAIGAWAAEGEGASVKTVALKGPGLGPSRLRLPVQSRRFRVRAAPRPENNQ
jgi:hypothetical protein